MFFLLPAFLVASHTAATAAAVSPLPTLEASGFDQGPLETIIPIRSRNPSQPFTLKGVGELAAPFGIEYHGLARIFTSGNRAIDTFVLDRNTLLANGRSGSCYVYQNMGYLACEDVPERVPQTSQDFSLATNGSLLYNGTANWWACSDRQSDVYNVYYRQMSPSCKSIQLQSGAAPKTKRSLLKHSVEMIIPDSTENIDTRTEKGCFFYMRTSRIEPEFYDLNNQLRKSRIYTLLGKRFGTGPNGFHYCYINAATFQLVCAEKTSEQLMENFHSIDFSINEKGYLTHNGVQDWVFCKTSKGWDGPYSEKNVSDSKCEAITLEIMVTVIAGYDCRPQMTKPSILTRARGATVSALDLRSLDNQKKTTEAPLIVCPTNLSNTLFKSPTLLIPISSESKTQALGSIKNITITPTQSIVFAFSIPSTKPYENKECALLLLLPEIDSLNIDYQEGQIPGLQFYEVGGPVDEHTAFDTLPISPLLVSKPFPNEIRPGKNNFVTTLACGSGAKSIMVASRGGLSLGVRQEGVPNESGLHLVPCVEEAVV